jgi:esterase/lipase superfamily enzyme
MSDLTLLGGFLAAGLAALVALVAAWRWSAGLGGLTRLLLRTVLLLAVLAPLVLLGGLLIESENSSEPTASAPEQPSEPMPKMSEPEPGKPVEREEAKPGAPAEPDQTAEVPPEPTPAPGGGAPAPTPGPKDDEGASRGLEEPGSEAPQPTPPSPTPSGSAVDETGWDIVPVFYGTDRSRKEGAPGARLDYGDGRGRRLELGQALVTVPKSHTVPQIERPWTFTIPFIGVRIGESEDPNEHFTMREIKALSREEFLALVGERLARSQRFKKHAIIFVHGFNTTFDYAIYRTAQISYDLKFDGAAFSYSWPSGGAVLNYTYDRESSGQALPYLKEFVKLVLEQSGAEAVSLVAHSMGNQPTLQVLKDLKASKPEGVVFHEIILAAPDVDRDNFENIALEIKGLAKGVTLYAANNDRALAISRRVNGGVPRAGDVPAEGPLVIADIDTIDVSATSTDSLGLNHSGYAENNDLLADLKVLIETGTRPPVKRITTTKAMTSPKGAYWQLVPAPKPPAGTPAPR